MITECSWYPYGCEAKGFCENILAATQGLDEDSWTSQEALPEAVLKKLQLLGLAVDQLPRVVFDLYPHVDWKAFIALGYVLDQPKESWKIRSSFFWRMTHSEVCSMFVALQDLLEGKEQNPNDPEPLNKKTTVERWCSVVHKKWGFHECVEELIAACERTLSTTKDIDKSTFLPNTDPYEAVRWNMHCMGCAVFDLPRELFDVYPKLDWKFILAMGYGAERTYLEWNVADEVLWRLIEETIPKLLPTLKKIQSMQGVCEEEDGESVESSHGELVSVEFCDTQ